MVDRLSSTLVDWGLAERVAITLAGAAGGDAALSQAEVTMAAERAVERVGAYTRLRPTAPLPEAEAVDRREWVRANVAALHGMSADAERRLIEAVRIPERLRSLTRMLAGTVSGAELGVVLGYAGRKVLGQYDVALIGPARPPRLLFVGPNLVEAHARVGGERRLFVEWIALHEATHAFQFASVPWLRPHIGGIVEELLGAASVDAGRADLGAALRRLIPPPDPRRIVELLDEGGLLRLLAGPEQVRLLRALQETMAVIEGYAEHVMDASGARVHLEVARLRDAVEAERDRRRFALDKLLARLLGLDMKLRQYRVGKRFSDAVVERSGIDALNEVWRGPDALPDSDELERPERWAARVGVG